MGEGRKFERRGFLSGLGAMVVAGVGGKVEAVAKERPYAPSYAPMYPEQGNEACNALEQTLTLAEEGDITLTNYLLSLNLSDPDFAHCGKGLKKLKEFKEARAKAKNTKNRVKKKK